MELANTTERDMSTSTSTSMTVQLVALRLDACGSVITAQIDDDAPVDMTFAQLNRAQHQQDVSGWVYRWLVREHNRCADLQRAGQPWESPRTTLDDICGDPRNEPLTVHVIRGESADVVEDRARREWRAAYLQDMTERTRIAEERRALDADAEWYPIHGDEVPAGIRFDTPRRNQGQIVEVQYGTFGRAEADSCDPYMHVVDHSDGTQRTYQRRTV